MAAMLVVIVPALLLAAAVALLPAKRIATDIAAQVESATGAKFEPGQADMKLLGGFGLMLTDGRLRGDGAELLRRTGTGQGLGAYDIAYSRLEVSLAVWPLLQKKVQLRSLRLEGPQLQVALPDDLLRMKSFEFQVSDLHLALAAPAGVGSAPGDLIPADLACRLRANVALIEYGGTTWTGVSGQGKWSGRALDFDNLTGRLGEGSLELSGRLDYADDPWGVLTWRAKLGNLPSVSLLAPYVSELGDKLICGLSGEATGSLALKDKASRLASLTAEGTITAGEGVLHAEQWLQGVARYLGQRQDLRTVRFSRLTHRLAVADGLYKVESLEIDGVDTDWQVTGWLGIGDQPEVAGKVDLALGVRLPAGFTPVLGSLSFLAESLRDAEKRVNLGLKISGRLVAPTVGLDLAGLGRRR
jgi:hypothetical protein